MGNMINIGLTSSHSCRYMIHALFFFSFSWVDVDSIMSNKTMEYDPIREIFSIDPIDAIVLDEFVKRS